MQGVIQVRSLLLFLHLLVTAVIFTTKYQNIAVSQVTDLVAAASYVDLYLILTVVLLSTQILSSLLGLQLYALLLPFQISLQGVGLFAYVCFILLRMPYQTISFMWGVFTLLAWILDVVATVIALRSHRRYSHLAK